MISYTALKHQIDDFSQKAVVLKVQGDPQSRLTISLDQPSDASITLGFQDLVRSNEAFFTRPFPWESAMIQRLVFKEHYHTSFTIRDEYDGEGTSWYYVRVVQANEQLAWSSPVWVEGKQPSTAAG